MYQHGIADIQHLEIGSREKRAGTEEVAIACEDGYVPSYCRIARPVGINCAVRHLSLVFTRFTKHRDRCHGAHTQARLRIDATVYDTLACALMQRRHHHRYRLDTGSAQRKQRSGAAAHSILT